MPEAINAGVRISYDVFGDGRPLILLHGWSCDRAWWTETGFVENLRRDHRVINVDFRGHGASDKPHEPDAYHQATVANDVIAVADAEGLDRFAIWGISYGGWVAWVTADAYPERVAAIVVTGQWDASPGTDDAAWQAFEDSWLSALRSNGMDGL
jgi:pimeloyl-ACP methyl ester carboxylesterase